MIRIRDIAGVAHQAAGLGKVPIAVRGRNAVVRGQVNNLDAPAVEERVKADEQRVRLAARE